tara:strand:+ start:245 stop:667 length:423 start_codon:yes stop_codon:yes gene_type:complete
LNRILAIDYGDVRIGLAMSDLMHIIAKPYKTIKNNNHNEVFIELQNIIEENNVGKIIVGLPITLKGEHSEQTNKVISFVKELKSFVEIDVATYDERLSSYQAKKSLVHQGIKTGHNKEKIDQTAAAIFLQGYIDSVPSKK